MRRALFPAFLLLGMAPQSEEPPPKGVDWSLTSKGGRLTVLVEGAFPDGLVFDIYIHRMEEVLDQGVLSPRKGKIQTILQDVARGGKMQTELNLLPAFAYRVAVGLDPGMQRAEIRKKLDREKVSAFRLERVFRTGVGSEKDLGKSAWNWSVFPTRWIR
jgi:hypothetical protein